MSGGFSDMHRIDLIDRNRILIRSMATDDCTRQILIGIRVTVDVASSRMGEARVDCDLVTEWFEHIEDFGQLEVPLATARKPTPVHPSRIRLQGQSDSVGMIDTNKPFWCCVGDSLLVCKCLHRGQS